LVEWNFGECCFGVVSRDMARGSQVMRTVQISDSLKDVIDRHVAEGIAASEAEFVDEAVRRYVDALADDTDVLIAAANEGIEAIRRGQYVTISGPEDRDAFWQRVWSRTLVLAEDSRVAGTVANEENQVSAHTAG